jgi:branched-subunit amino acid aminotransferase/4-amino-4-deoxychorismate lyase
VGIVSTVTTRVEINGRTATADHLQYPALVNYGHFTAMQVRHGRTRGLDLHLSRLDAATRDLFGANLDTGRIREHLRHALADIGDASVRVSVFCPETDDNVSIMVTVRPPADPPDTPQSLKSVPYQRPIPQIKHAGTFAQTYYGRLAKRHGFDDALLTGPGGDICEGAISNIAFYDHTTVIWPDAPCLVGITMQLLEPRLAGYDLPTRRGPVRLADLPSFSAAFVTNSLGIAPVGRIDGTTLPVNPRLMKSVIEIYESVTWEQI